MFPRWMCQRRTIWAGDLPSLSASSAERRLVEHLALRDRRPGLRRDPVRSSVGVDVGVVEVRMELDLVHRRHDVRLRGQALEMRHLEVRHADRARAAVLAELLERLPGRDEVAVVEGRQRPVDEEQVDVVGAELGQRLRERLPRASSGSWKPLLSLLVMKTSARSRPEARTASPTPLLVAVHLGGVDMPVTGLERDRSRPGRSPRGGIWKTPKPSCGIARPSFRIRVGTGLADGLLMRPHCKWSRSRSRHITL